MITLLVLILLAALVCAIWWQNVALTSRDERIGYLTAELAAAEADLRRSQTREPFGYRRVTDCPRKPAVVPTRPVYAGHTPPSRATTVELDLAAWDAELEGLPYRHVADGRPAHFRDDGTLVLPHERVPTVSQLAQMLAA